MLYVRYKPIHPYLNVAAPMMDAVGPWDEPKTAAQFKLIKADLAETVKERWPSTRDSTDGSLEITLYHWIALDG